MRHRRRLVIPCVMMCGVLVMGWLAACASEPGRNWRLPPGKGEVRYSPERGIYREGSTPVGDEEKLYQAALALFQSGQYAQAAEAFHRLRSDDAGVDGARALDAIMFEAVALLEAGRSRRSDWLWHDLANLRLDQDPQALARLPQSLPELITEQGLHDLVQQITHSGAVERSWEVVKETLTYYTLALGIAPERMHEATRQARNLAWLALLAEEYKLAERIAQDLIDRHPRAEIRSQTELLLARAFTAMDSHERAQNLYARVYAGSRNPDLREEALLGEIRAILARSKGEEYNVALYELALDKLNDYRYDFLAVHPDARLRSAFHDVARSIEQSLIAMEVEAAEAYRRLGEDTASALYLARAEQLRRAFEAQRNGP